MIAATEELIARWREVGPGAWCESPFGWTGDDGQSITLADWQRAVLSAWWECRADVTTLAISNIKKTGKTLINAVLLCWRWLALPGEHFAVGNDLDQSQGRQFQMIAEVVRRNPYLRENVTITRSQLVFEPTGSTLTALPVDAAGNAGANHLTASHTESWGIIYEAGVRAYEELTPPPGTRYGLPALRIADSYAGYEGESKTWHDLVDRGLAGERIGGDWPIYRNGGLLLFHIEGDEAQARCFRGTPAEAEAYYSEQRASLRRNAFIRQHENRRVTGTEAFVTAEQWDALVMDGYFCPTSDKTIRLAVGVDLAVKHDSAAVVSTFRAEGRPWLGPYRIWKPPVDLGVVEQYIADLAEGYTVALLNADPFQAMQMLQNLRARGIRANEFPQTVERMTRAGNALFDVIRQRQLAVYAGADDLRRHVLNASARETERGIRLVKEARSRKIDAAIALAMSVLPIVERSALWRESPTENEISEAPSAGATRYQKSFVTWPQRTRHEIITALANASLRGKL